MYSTVEHHSYDNLLLNNRSNKPSILSYSSDELEMDIPETVYKYKPLHIERPPAPFPGQMFHGQRHQNDFNDFLVEIFDAFLKNKLLTFELFNIVYELIKPEFHDSNILMQIMNDILTIDTIITSEIINKLRETLMINGYSQVPNQIWNKLQTSKSLFTFK